MIELSTLIDQIRKIGLAYQKKLKKLGISTLQDLLYYFPARYDDFSEIVPIKKAKLGYTVCVQGRILEIESTRTFKKFMSVTEALIEDETGTIKATWFNQPYLAKSLKEDDLVCLAGKVSLGKDGIYLNNPVHERVADFEDINSLTHTGRIVPVYSETRGLTSRWLRYVIKPLISIFQNKLPEVLPQELIKKQRLLDIKQAIKQVHFPDSFDLADAAKARFSFEELLLLQLFVMKEKIKMQKIKAPACIMDVELMKEFTNSLPFTLTDSQRQCIYQILKDLEKDMPMSRLLEGDVGSGKTVVATMAALNVIKSGYSASAKASAYDKSSARQAGPLRQSSSEASETKQVAFMAPTEILTKQHFKNVIKMLENFNVSVGILTGKEAKIFRNKEEFSVKKETLAEDLKNGQIDIVIGTHSLIQKGIEFKNLALVVVDEQHRFGDDQRAALSRGNNAEQTQNNSESGTLLYEDLSYKIRQFLFNVKKELGPGHKEIVYQKALEEEFKNAHIPFSKEKQIPILYHNKKVGIYVPDFIIDEKIIVELKALSFLGSTEKKQIWNYLKGSEYKLAILVNFGPKELQIDRVIYDLARDSAFVPHSSAFAPHLLSMTATPIPRTLALTVYGDLDLSLIKEMPKNRKKIKTQIVNPSERRDAYEFIREEVKEGKGVFVICPKIESKPPASPDERARRGGKNLEDTQVSFVPINYNFASLLTQEIKAVKEEYEKLSKEIFPELNIAMLHGKMKPKEKEETMINFRDGKIDILISTSVIEVGVDVPRATVMMIEGAERFGLSQLHQFRGRVGRSDMQSYCFLFTTSPDQLNRRRLKALVESNNGFELAQKDLEIRGPGSLYGTQQWGIPDMAMQGLSNIFLVEKPRAAAKELLEKDPELKNYPELKERLKQFQTKIHFE